MNRTILTFLAAAILSLPHVTNAQTTPVPGPPETPSDQGPAAPRPPLSNNVASDRHDLIPYLNLYLPEGEASLRIRKLIQNVLFETQINYRFVSGDIDTFLRYKYYARNFTYKLSVFDSIQFASLGGSNSREFERTRGGLLLFEAPRNYEDRYFGLVEFDHLTFGDLTQVDNKKSNLYTKIGYQYGTQFDERLNSIVGETRGAITPVLTAFRDIGPQKMSLAAALTESYHFSKSSYRYTKLEAEGIRRFDVSDTSFFVSRLHAGAFLTRDTIRGTNYPQVDRYSIPRYELFDLASREAMRGVHSKDDSLGTHEFHETNEYFVPVFRNKDFQTWQFHWNTLYAIGYAGVGAAGFGYRGLVASDHLAMDAGLGAESAFAYRDYNVLLSVVYAHTLKAPENLRGGRLLFSVKTVR